MQIYVYCELRRHSVIVKGSGHWLIDEAPDQVIPKLVEFFKP
jgi:hypothetical protein